MKGKNYSKKGVFGLGIVVLVLLCIVATQLAFFTAQMQENDSLVQMSDELIQTETTPTPYNILSIGKIEETVFELLNEPAPVTIDTYKIKVTIERKENLLIKESQYVISTKQTTIAEILAIQEESYFGTLESAAMGFSVRLCYSLEQSVCDAVNSANVITTRLGHGNTGLAPIGMPNIAAVVGDHNDQSFKALANAQIGQRLYAKTTYGEYLYEVTSIHRGNIMSNGFELYLDNGIELFSSCGQGRFPNQLALYTCYPFAGSDGGGYDRYVVLCSLVAGTTAN